jgi:hypothetical protein
MFVSYDTRCFELAEYFLIDEPDFRHKVGDLAQAIQDAIDDWLDAQRAEAEKQEDV